MCFISKFNYYVKYFLEIKYKNEQTSKFYFLRLTYILQL